MAIRTECPYCSKTYRLKDELAGKKATCNNPECRKTFVVKAAPVPVKAPSLDAEALAAAAFADDPNAVVPEDERRIELVCATCDHKWDVPWAMQGKNVLCPDCRTRIKIPEQKTKKMDWRDEKGGLPSLAKREELEGVVSAGDARQVSGKTLRETGVIESNIEPRPRWHFVALVATPLAILLVLGYVGYSYFAARSDTKQAQFMEDAVKEIQEATDTAVPSEEHHLYQAALLIAAAEYDIRLQDPEKTKRAVANLTKARTELEAAKPPAGILGRDFLFAELLSVQILLGGDDDEIEKKTRIRWAPKGAGTERGKINEKILDVKTELAETLTGMREANLDARHSALRRLTRELSKRGHFDLLESIALRAFAAENDVEVSDARALMALEALKAAGKAAEAKLVAEQLQSKNTSFTLALCYATEVKKVPNLGTGTVDDTARQAETAYYLFADRLEDALATAKRPGLPASRCKALALVAEISPAPGPVIDAAAEIVAVDGKNKGSVISDTTLLRLAEQAGRANQPEKAKQFIDLIQKDDAKAWARAVSLHQQLIAGGPKPADESLAPIPDNPKEHRVGVAWSRLMLARHNAALSPTPPPGTYDRWGNGTYHPFGLAGHALGLQDREKR